MSDITTQMKPTPKNMQGALTLANVSTIAAGVMRGLVGRSVADSIGGSQLVQDKIAQIVCARVTKNLQARTDAAKRMRLQGY